MLKSPDWKKFWMTKEPKIELSGIPVRCVSCSFEGSGFNPTYSVVGVDPGRNFGITWIDAEDQEIRIYSGTLPDDSHEKRGMQAMDLIKEFCEYHCVYVGDKAVIEGAAYEKLHGQVALAEVRFGFFAGMEKFGLEPTVVPPQSVRKTVFGSAKIHAGDLWPILNDNAADSLGVALYPYFAE